MGAGKFSEYIISLYQHIGYLYRHCEMYSISTDYFKKSLFMSWQKGKTLFEVKAYHELAI